MNQPITFSFSTSYITMNNIVEPNSVSTMLFSIVDNHGQCRQQNVAQVYLIQTYDFWYCKRPPVALNTCFRRIITTLFKPSKQSVCNVNGMNG